ncbi:vesicle-associated protein 4-2-like [Wolffia australiana]
MAMAMAEERSGKARGLCSMSFWQRSGGGTSSASSTPTLTHKAGIHAEGMSGEPKRSRRNKSMAGVSSMAKAVLPVRRRLRLDPARKLYFPYEPGKQVRSAVMIKNSSKSHVAFKFQTTAPKSCFMRPPGAILAPGESLIATVFKFVEHPENNERPQGKKSRVKFKILSLKVPGPMDYVPELFDEQKDQVSVERILRVVFLDPERPSPPLEKLKRQLAEADLAAEARKKPPPEDIAGPRIVGEGLVIDEWKERRERYLARQQGDCVESL